MVCGGVINMLALRLLAILLLSFRRCTPKVRSWPAPSGTCEDTGTSLRSPPLSGLLFSGQKEKVSEFVHRQSVFSSRRSDLLNPGLVFNRSISGDPPPSLAFVSTSFLLSSLAPR